MIRRDSREPMRQIWTEENKFALWLRIEILACEARHIPRKDLATIKRRVRHCFAISIEAESDCFLIIRNCLRFATIVVVKHA